MGAPQGHKSCQQSCFSVGSSLHGATHPARTLLQHKLPMGPELPLGISQLWCGIFCGIQVDLSPAMDPHGPQGAAASPWAPPWLVEAENKARDGWCNLIFLAVLILGFSWDVLYHCLKSVKMESRRTFLKGWARVINANKVGIKELDCVVLVGD